MKNQTVKSEVFESTYAMLVRSEERERNVSETAIYLLLILSTLFSIWHVAQQRLVLPTVLDTASVTHTAVQPQRSV